MHNSYKLSSFLFLSFLSYFFIISLFHFFFFCFFFCGRTWSARCGGTAPTAPCAGCTAPWRSSSQARAPLPLLPARPVAPPPSSCSDLWTVFVVGDGCLVEQQMAHGRALPGHCCAYTLKRALKQLRTPKTVVLCLWFARLAVASGVSCKNCPSTSSSTAIAPPWLRPQWYFVVFLFTQNFFLSSFVRALRRRLPPRGPHGGWPAIAPRAQASAGPAPPPPACADPPPPLPPLRSRCSPHPPQTCCCLIVWCRVSAAGHGLGRSHAEMGGHVCAGAQEGACS